MINAEVYCPEPCIGCPPVVQEECGESKAVIWSANSTQSVFFYTENINLRVIGFIFTPVFNNGSIINISLKYYRGSDYVTAQTYNLGTLPSLTTKYHYIDLGVNLPENTYIQLEVTTSDGTSGRFNVELDCYVNVSSRDFCYTPNNTNPYTLCSKCPTEVKIYWEQAAPLTQLFFKYDGWYTDPTLQTPAPAGYYSLLNNTSKQIYYFDGSNARKNNDCVCTNIDCGSTTTLNHVKAGYTFSNPYIPGLDEYPTSSLKYSVKCTTVNLDTTNYGYVTVVFTVNGSREDAGFTVQDVNMANGGVGFLSYSSDTTGKMFYPISNATLLRPKKGQNTLRVNILVNASDNSKTLGLIFRASVGQKTKYRSNNTVSTQLQISCPTPIYKYTVGLHTYSPYDSYFNPKLTTDLYSTIPITSWVRNTTLVFNDPLMSHPAMPWFYGYSGTSKVYKVGVPYDRSFGTKKVYQVKTNLARRFAKWIGISKQSNKINEIIQGPKKWDGSDEYHVPACIEPLMDPGYIKTIYNSNTLPQPSTYRYYVGISTTSQVSANDSVFTTYDFGAAIHYGATGFEHAMTKTTSGYVSGLRNDVLGPNINLTNGELSAFAAAGLGVAAISLSVGITVKIISLATYSSVLAFLECPPILTVGIQASAALGPVGAIVIAAIALAIVLYALFKTTTTYLEEICKEFTLVFTDSPYVELGERIYGRPNFTQRQDGKYIVDGAYYYFTNATTGVVTTKKLSYTIRDGVYVYSTLPDVPVKVTEIPKLFFLPYTSGLPVAYSSPPTTFKSSAVSVSMLPTNVGALNNPLPVNFTFPSGFTESTVSQAEADDDVNSFLSGLTANTQSSWVSSEQKPGVSAHTMTFTHELKIENPPAKFDVAYDNANNSGMTINKVLYYDINGKYSVLNGFYAKDAEDGINYKKFYETSAGTVIDIYVMSAVTATTVQSQQTSTIYPIATTYTGYTSSWYFTSPIIEDTFYHELNNLFDFNNIWNTNEFYSNSVIRRGFTNTPITLLQTYLYDSNTSLSTFELSPSAWYKEIPEVYNQEPYLYSTGDTIYLHFEQYCSEDDTNGIYIICKDDEGNEIASFVGVSLGFYVYLWLNEEGVNQEVFYQANILPTESRTFVELPQSYINNIYEIELGVIYGQNPNFNFFFTTGSTTLCSFATPTPSPQEFTPTPEPTPTITPTQSNTPTYTPTQTITQTPSPTEGGIQCIDYYNNTGNPLNGINYVDCSNNTFTNVTVNAGDSICAQLGSLNGGDSGFLQNIGNCGIYYPTATPTPSQTPTPTITPSTDVYFYYDTVTYNCGINGASCTDPSTGTAVLRFSTSQTSVWFSNGITSYSRTGSTIGPSYDVNGDLLATGISCVAACTA